jgi:hypothetical protein
MTNADDDIKIRDTNGIARRLAAPSEPLTAWQRAFREGFAPLLSTEGLRSLANALKRDDPRVITGATVYPPPLAFCGDEPVQKCCPVAWAALDGYPLNAATVALLDARFSELCFKADALLGEPTAVRYLLNEIDTWDRETMRQNLLGEVEWALSQRDEREGGAA